MDGGCGCGCGCGEGGVMVHRRVRAGRGGLERLVWWGDSGRGWGEEGKGREGKGVGRGGVDGFWGKEIDDAMELGTGMR